MNIVRQLTSLVAVAAVCCVAPTHAGVYDTLRADMEAACPATWEDLGVAINSQLPAGQNPGEAEIWLGNNADKQAFLDQYTGPDADAGNLTIVVEHCASYRIALLDELLEHTPIDAAQAMVAAGQNINTQYMGWLPGDVRVTGRATAADGWVFMHGQSIGNASSTADDADDKYAALFELVKTWAPNNGTEVWANGDVVSLPDMRGRAMYGADNMGGTSANTLTAAEADQVGGAFGSQDTTLAVTNLPPHNHTLNSGGSHSHTINPAGSHNHKLRSSIYTGSSSGGSGHLYFEGKGRPNYQNTIQSAVTSEPNHSHGMGSAGSHTHTVNSTGDGTAVTTVSPGIVFNVEMKY